MDQDSMQQAMQLHATWCYGLLQHVMEHVMDQDSM